MRPAIMPGWGIRAIEVQSRTIGNGIMRAIAIDDLSCTPINHTKCDESDPRMNQFAHKSPSDSINADLVTGALSFPRFTT